jgi:hypothetical protein
MISRTTVTRLGRFAALAALMAGNARAAEIFIYRPGLNKTSLSVSQKVVLHGEIFFHYLSPSTFPSYNDLSGAVDRWNMGFQNYFPITPTTTLMAQLVTHDDGTQRTKFDWHFHLRQALFQNLVAIVGHDSDHDSEHQSFLRGKPYYTNRNYIGIGIPFEGRHFFIEPFTWFFHHSNQMVGLDLSGERLRQEYGLRASVWADEGLSVHLQTCFQTAAAFSLGQAFSGEIILRLRLVPWLELSLGGSLWADLEKTALGAKQSFSKLVWGIAVPF